MKKILRNKKLIYLLLAAFLMRLVLAFFGTYQLDHNTFIAWGRNIAQNGVHTFYTNGWSDYLPGYLYVLGGLATLEKVFSIPTVLLYKLPAIIGDILMGVIVYLAAKKATTERNSLIATAFFVFNPAVWANSTTWGQVDIFSSLFSVGSIFFLNNPILSPLLLAIGGSIKPQAAMTLPIIFALMLKNRWPLKRMITYVALLTMFFVLIFLPFSNNVNLIAFIFDRVSVTMGQYPYGSVNAFNLWGLWGFWKPDTEGLINAKIIGNIIVLLFSLLSFLVVLKNKDKKYLGLAFLFLVNFLFLTRMHERHMLPVFAPLAIAAASSSFLWIIYTVLSLTYISNLYYAYQFIDNNKNFYIPDIGVKIIIIINLIIFALFLANFLFNKFKNFDVIERFNRLKSRIKEHERFDKDLIKKSTARKYLLAILFFATLTRVVNLAHPNEFYFDEIYHEFTARRILHTDPQAWHWSADHPEGFAYEWTHPPFGKEVMAASMFVLGENHFAARLPGAILGVGIVYLTYLLALHLTKRNDISLLAAFFIATDGLTFTMSRIATVDVYFVFFAILTLYLLLKERYGLSSLALGLSAATKWSTAWMLPVLAVAFFTQKLKWKKSLIFFAIIPPLVYLISYLPMFSFGHDLNTFKGMQQQMWWYHSGLEATHGYSSRWWSWPLNLRPVYLYQYDEGTGFLGNIYAMGNPFFFWTGLVSVLLAFYFLIRRQLPKVVGFVLFAYLALFIPWAASPRIMFIYHYMPALPFLAILSAIIIRKFPKLIIPVIIILFISFIYFYPHWSGIPVPEDISKSYYWLKSWR